MSRLSCLFTWIFFLAASLAPLSSSCAAGEAGGAGGASSLEEARGWRSQGRLPLSLHLRGGSARLDRWLLRPFQSQSCFLSRSQSSPCILVKGEGCGPGAPGGEEASDRPAKSDEGALRSQCVEGSMLETGEVSVPPRSPPRSPLLGCLPFGASWLANKVLHVLQQQLPARSKSWPQTRESHQQEPLSAGKSYLSPLSSPWWEARGEPSMADAPPLHPQHGEKKGRGSRRREERLRASEMGDLSQCLSSIDGTEPSTGGGMNTVLEDPKMEEEYAKSYINGYAALVWNEDGTSARGLVPVRYYSESDSSSPRDSQEEGQDADRLLGCGSDERTGSGQRASGGPGRQEEPGLVSTRTLRRLDERAERVKALWERQGFSTYWDLRWTPNGGQREEEREEEEREEREEKEERGEEEEEEAAAAVEEEEDRPSFQSVAYSWREVSKKDGDRSLLDASEKRGPCSAYSLQGRRPTMEDAFASLPCSGRTDVALMAGKWRLFGMFDGHGGTRCSHFCRDELLSNVASFIPAGGASCDQVCEALIEGFLYSDRKFLLHAERLDWIDGSTAIVVALSSSEIIVANAGDCRAVLGVVRSSGDAGELIVDSIAMSRDHRLDDEEEVARVQSMGGFVLHRYGSGIPRVMGVLAVSRALGDASLKPYVTAEPDISLIARADEQWFIVLATDGLWDVFSNEEAVNFILAHMIEGAPDCGARALAHAAFKRGSTDNISVMVIDLRRGRG